MCFFFCFLLFFFLQEYVFWWSVSLYYEGKWWGVSYYTPLAGISFYFPEEYLCSIKTLIKNLQWVVKGLVCVAAAVTTVILPLQKLTSKQQESFTGEFRTFITLLCTLRLRLGRMMDSGFSCRRVYWVILFQKDSSCLMIPFGGINQVCYSISFARIRCLLLCTLINISDVWLDYHWMLTDYESIKRYTKLRRNLMGCVLKM